MPKIIDHDKYRRELLSKCLDIFAAKGYGVLTVRELAAELGVSTGTLYHYWAGKQEIFEDLVTCLTEQDRVMFLQAAGEPETLEKRIEALVTFVSHHESYFLKQFFIGMDYYRQQGGKEEILKNLVIKQSNELYREGLGNFLGIRDPDIITFVLSVLTGVVIGRMYEGEFVSIEAQGRMLTRMLMRYVQEGG